MLDILHAGILFDPITIIKTGGYVGVALLVFAESGILLGMFLPGDSLLFAAGILSAAGLLHFGWLVLIVVTAAIAGDSVGYWFGARVGTSLFKRPDSRFFKQEYVERTKHFYQKYGGRALILARFVPIVRTLAPILAGVGSMEYRTFISYNAVGGILWGAGVVSLGYFLGALIPNSEHYLLPIMLVIGVISFLPIVLNIIRSKRSA
jgi:membrane-associated protein